MTSTVQPDSYLRCVGCGHDLSALSPSDTCPVCGREVTEALNKSLRRSLGPTRSRIIGISLLVLAATSLLLLACYSYVFGGLSSPLWLQLPIALVHVGFILFVSQRFLVRPNRPCSLCGYNLKFCNSPRCPECGSWIAPDRTSHVAPQ